MTVEVGVIDDATAPAPEPQTTSKESCLNPNAEEFVSDAVLDTTLVIKNKQDSDEKCVKCSRKVCNGLQCSSCKEAWHWGCSHQGCTRINCFCSRRQMGMFDL